MDFFCVTTQPQVDKKVLVFEKQIFCKYFFKNVEPRYCWLVLTFEYSAVQC